jgi:CHAT domain-containing protein
VVGLADGFFAAGASQLVVSLWEVDDRATAELMSRFYTHLLLHGRRASDALRRAQRELRDETEWSSPAYWAAFIALGDWQTGADLLGRRSGGHSLAQFR